MNEIEKMKHSDIHKKNKLALIAFSLSVVSALILAIIEGDLNKSIYYVTEVSALFLGYFILKHALKKELYYPYYIVLVAYIYALLGIYLFGNNFSLTIIFFFLLFLST